VLYNLTSLSCTSCSTNRGVAYRIFVNEGRGQNIQCNFQHARLKQWTMQLGKVDALNGYILHYFSIVSHRIVRIRSRSPRLGLGPSPSGQLYIIYATLFVKWQQKVITNNWKYSNMPLSTNAQQIEQWGLNVPAAMLGDLSRMWMLTVAAAWRGSCDVEWRNTSCWSSSSSSVFTGGCTSCCSADQFHQHLSTSTWLHARESPVNSRMTLYMHFYSSNC